MDKYSSKVFTLNECILNTNSLNDILSFIQDVGIVFFDAYFILVIFQQEAVFFILKTQEGRKVEEILFDHNNESLSG